ncbi:hypothetical protein [Ornithinibacillus halotolerans]|uniref:Lipoprotein n=1 Tax=Ornithinibacillus halotolerans TaxID=1274357 RepID=A0A916W299_9BACI|nr:hypothetical protein [Ornithinibacillus halotolerans]GGA60428.1 hypothetical protein GCM10008025_00560 [Ornithinibacillus halotolerans]
MRKQLINLVLVMLILLSACDEKSNNNEVSEEEKLLVTLTTETKHLEELYQLVSELKPIEILNINETENIEIYDGKEFDKFVPNGSWITEVSKTDNTNNELITIDYRLNNQRIIVEYFEDGMLRKYNLNRETGILLVNDNGDYQKDYFEHLDRGEK